MSLPEGPRSSGTAPRWQRTVASLMWAATTFPGASEDGTALNVNELREAFLSFFEEHGHLRIPSSSLVPHGDPTLLFTTAGMVQFKSYFTGLETPPAPRMTSIQRCFRTVDVEEVGDASHLTFFEMLGNFSIGDYFKPEAIAWAWEFLTARCGIDPDRLWATVYVDDDEAFDLWADRGLPPERILRYTAEQGNWWGPPGDSGPCGPCSELHYDFGPTPGCVHCNDGVCHPDLECGRFLEIWNLVFTVYDQDEDGNRTPLPAQNIDTGAGLERLAWVLGSGRSVYDTDELSTVVAVASDVSGRAYDADESPEVARALRSIAEHARAIAFLVNDGVMPGNEGRGYVLRRVLRRAVYFGHQLGLRDAFIERVIDGAIDASLPYHPSLEGQRDFIRRIAALEEARFQSTLQRGLDLLDEVIERERGTKLIPGRDMFTLYDTHGLPPELTREVAASEGYSVDNAGFEAQMEAQRQRSRGESGGDDAGDDRAQRYAALALRSEFEGYESLAVTSTVSSLVADGARVESIAAGPAAEIVLAATAFYPEGGGQIADRGEIVTPGGRFRVDDVQRYAEAIVHLGEVTEGTISAGESAESRLDRDHRAGSMRNHTATHLLHAALRQVLGTHVRQGGSYVGPDRLRFDYTHPEAPAPEILRTVQRLVNAKVRDDITRDTLELPFDEAMERGAIAFFEDRYAANVRVVEFCEAHGHGHNHAPECFSRELCGGTHLHSTGQIGQFVIVADSSIGAGLRRIEALTGPAAEQYVEQRLDVLSAVAQQLRVPPAEVPGRVEALEQQLAEERTRTQQSRRAASADLAEELAGRAEELDGVRLLVARVEADSADALLPIADRLRELLGSAFVTIGADIDGRPVLLAAATDDVVERGLHADEIVRAAARLVGGGGGGRPQLAQAGGRDVAQLDAALDAAREAARGQLAGN